MNYIMLHKQNNNRVVYISKQAITAVSIADGKTAIFIVGDSIPFEVTESIDEVMSSLENREV